MAVLGLGLAALGRPGYMTLGHGGDVADASVEGLQGQTHRVLDAAYAGGVRHVDVARSYGRGEAFLRAWLEARGHRDVFISSKWGYRYTAGWKQLAAVHEVKDLSAAHLDAQVAESRAALGPWLKLYQAHSVTLESGMLTDRDVLRRLDALRAGGLAMGLSVTGAEQPKTIRAALELGVFDWVQATWNVLEPSAEDALAAAKARGLRVIVKEALANGRLTSRGDVPDLLRAAREADTTADALALAAALRQPWADVVLSGASTVEQLQSNLAARAVTAPELGAFREAPEAYWSRRATLPWT
ncbi:MAG: aldo/keto reductase [Archangium sp.]|nr:aldo/keto reductase [Archangium sp.]